MLLFSSRKDTQFPLFKVLFLKSQKRKKGNPFEFPLTTNF